VSIFFLVSKRDMFRVRRFVRLSFNGSLAKTLSSLFFFCSSLFRSAMADNIAISSPNIVWEDPAVTRSEREIRNGHLGAVIWFTGLSGSGKSTIAKILERRLFSDGRQVMSLDGDNLRHGLNRDLSFTPSDRVENIRRAAEVALWAMNHGTIVLATFVSPYAEDRQMARTLMESSSSPSASRFLEVYVSCPLEVLRQRDPKGLYAKALRGEIPNFTGISAPYEPPENPDLVISTNAGSQEDSATLVLQLLKEKGIIPMT
jgi:adenylyl-sulfate kinase